MADAGVPALGAPPPVVVGPHLPFPGDPGSITGWMLESTAGESTLTTMTQLESWLTRLGNLPAPDAAGFATAQRALVDDVLSSDTLDAYLVVSNTPHDAPRVTVLHSIARYSAGLGGSNALHGRILGLMGEMIGDQLPTMIAFMQEADHDLTHALTMEQVTVQPTAAVEAYFAGAAALQVMPLVTAANGGVDMNMTCLFPIPLAWAVYFMDYKTPWDAYQMGRALVATLPDVAQRTQADPMLDWLRTSTQRLGAGAADRNRSVLDLEVNATVPSPRVVKFMKTRLDKFRLPIVPAAPILAPAGAGGLPPPAAGAAVLGVAHNNEFSPLETEKIQAACGITDAQWATDCPEFYGRMLEEGRKKAQVKALLEQLLRPTDPNDLNNVPVTTTDDMAEDMRKLDFGFSGDVTHITCHRGISPFSVLSMSPAAINLRKRKANRANQATHLSIQDLAEHETTPEAIPTTHLELQQLLRRYLGLLRVVVGENCTHRRRVRQLAVELGRQSAIYTDLTHRQIASLVWQIFLDARRFFCEGTDEAGHLPVSRLGYLVDAIIVGHVEEYANVPYGDLVKAPAYTPVPGLTPPKARSERTPDKGPKVYKKVPAEIKAALVGAREKDPNIRVTSIIRAAEPPLPYAKAKLGPVGACLDFMALGECKDNTCTYKHDIYANVSATQIARVAPKLKEAYQCYLAGS